MCERRAGGLCSPVGDVPVEEVEHVFDGPILKHNPR